MMVANKSNEVAPEPIQLKCACASTTLNVKFDANHLFWCLSNLYTYNFARFPFRLTDDCTYIRWSCMENGNGCALTFHYQNPIEYTVCCVCGVLIICIHSNIIDCMKCDKSVCVWVCAFMLKNGMAKVKFNFVHMVFCYCMQIQWPEIVLLVMAYITPYKVIFHFYLQFVEQNKENFKEMKNCTYIFRDKKKEKARMKEIENIQEICSTLRNLFVSSTLSLSPSLFFHSIPMHDSKSNA